MIGSMRRLSRKQTFNPGPLGLFLNPLFLARRAPSHEMTREGGMLLLTVPFVWDGHEQPYDYARYSTFGLRSLLERNGFNVLTQKKLLADSSVLFQLVNAYLFKVFHTRSALVNRLTVALLMAPVSALGLAFGALLPKNGDLFLDQLILAKRC